jgi:hypothetical protein
MHSTLSDCNENENHQPQILIALVTLSSLFVCDKAYCDDSSDALQKQELFELSIYGAGVAGGLEGMGKRISTRKVPNRIEKNSIDEIYTESVAAINTSWLRPRPTSEKLLLHSLTVSRSRHPITKRLGIGAYTETDIIGRYGTPAIRTSTALTYHALDSSVVDVQITFYIHSGKLQRIQWQWL